MKLKDWIQHIEIMFEFAKIKYPHSGYNSGIRRGYREALEIVKTESEKLNVDDNLYLTQQNKNTLQRARDIYGPRNQILVAAEECCELAKELLKYPRYDNHDTAIAKIRENVLDERADVQIVLNHIDEIFGISPEEISSHCERKIDRLRKWLDTSSSLEYSTELREVTEQTCDGCFWFDHWDDPERAKHCKECKLRGKR